MPTKTLALIIGLVVIIVILFIVALTTDGKHDNGQIDCSKGKYIIINNSVNFDKSIKKTLLEDCK